LSKKKSRLKELDKIISESNFWTDSERAQEVLKERSNIKNVVDVLENLSHELEDAEVLAELSSEEEDEETAKEAQTRLSEIEEKMERLEFKRRLGGDDDEKNAIVSINAGAGGTEAQDW